MTRIPVYITLFITLFTLSTSAQPSDYFSKRWIEADRASDKGLTETAIQQVLQIETSALKQGNDAQLLRAIMYRSGLYHLKYPQEPERQIQLFTRIIPALHEPYRQIAHSLVAELYQKYFDQHRYERAEKECTPTADISTWSRETLLNTITAHYRLSLEKPELLRQEAVSKYPYLFLSGTDSNLRPDLLDLLAHRAIDFFKSDPDDLGSSDTSMRTADPRLLEDYELFARNFNNSYGENALREVRRMYALLLQSFNNQHPVSDALIDADLDRLHTCWEYSTHENRNGLYEAALQKLNRHAATVPQQARIQLELARLYESMAHESSSNSQQKITLQKQQKQLLEHILLSAADSNTMQHARYDLSLLTKPSFTVEGAMAEIPNQPFLQGLKFSNCSVIYYRIVSVPNEVNSTDYESMDENNWKQLLKRSVTRSGKISLPEISDLQEHQTEFKLDGLPSGKWVLLYSIRPDFDNINNIRSVRPLIVSEIACINLLHHFALVNRQTGAPVAGARIRVHESFYDTDKQQTRYKPAEQYVSDKHGLFALHKDRTGRQVQLEVNYRNETVFIPTSRSNAELETTKDTLQEGGLIFQDRAIYRPGQTVYVKWISYSRNLKTGQSKPVFRKNIVLQFVNDEGTVLDSRQLITNEYGSCFTTFILPNTLLQGTFQIRDQQETGSSRFRIESYKRPQFEVTMQKKGMGYHLGDSVIITGKALLYSGSPLVRATGRYRINRTPVPDVFPWEFSWNSFQKRPSYSGSSVIETGTLQTDASGNFEFVFKAAAPSDNHSAGSTRFDFSIEAEITDASGETHQQSLKVRAGNQSIQMEIAPAKSYAAPLTVLPVRITDMDDQPVQARIDIQFRKLKVPDQPFRERYWSTPDIFIIDEQEFKSLFPADAYRNENEPANWPEDRNWFAEKHEYAYQPGNPISLQYPLAAGWYRLKLRCRASNGDSLVSEQLLQISQPGPEGRDLLVSRLDQEVIHPGTKAGVQISTGNQGLHIYHAVQEQDKLQSISYRYLTAKDSARLMLSEPNQAIGTIQFSCAFVWQNRFYTQQQVLNIKPESKPLPIKMSSFRDRVLPGSEETWELEISDSSMPAEVLLSMYDASLDQFTQHSWSGLPEIINYYPPISWSGIQLEGTTDETDNEWPDLGGTPEREYPIPGLLRWNKKPVFPGNYQLNWHTAPRWDYGVNYGSIGIPIFKLTTIKSAGSVDFLGYSTNFSTTLKLAKDEEIKVDKPVENSHPGGLKIRRDFRETAFFYPSLRTDSNGRVRFSFKMPDALTRWKLMALAHNEQMRFGSTEFFTVTDKPLTVQSNLPRFFREGDRLELMARITNSGDSELTGTITLNLTDAMNLQSINGWWKNIFPTQYITVPAHASVVVAFPVEVPYLFQHAALLRFSVSTGLYSDAEEQALPVLSARMELQESKLQLLPNSGKHAVIQFPNLAHLMNDPNTENRQLVIEAITNPVWIVLQALPYLQEFPYECAEQRFHRLYANLLGLWLTQSDTAIQNQITRWNQSAASDPLNRLEINPELRQTLIRETPWALEAASQEAHLRSLAQHFDSEKLKVQLQQNAEQLIRLQQPNGSFGWFGTNGPSDVYITQVIARGLSEINRPEFNRWFQLLQLKKTLDRAIHWLDAQLIQELNSTQKSPSKPMRLKYYSLSEVYWEYLSWRSKYHQIPLPQKLQPQVRRLVLEATTYWLRQSKSIQIFIAHTAWLQGNKKLANQIIQSLKEHAVTNPDGTIYWNNPETNTGSISNQTAVELQTSLIELFAAIGEQRNWIEGMRNWLLLQKTGQNWPGTKATARAVSVLVNAWHKDASQPIAVAIHAGERTFSQTSTVGYYRWVIPGDLMNESMQQITAQLINSSPARTQPVLLEAHWQYRQEQKEVRAAGDQIQVQKVVFREQLLNNKISLEELSEGTAIQAGERLVVRLYIKTRQALSYVHLRDLRAAGSEPVQVLSGYQYQNRLSFYQTHTDTGTDFFFSELPAGSFQIEYQVQANLPGVFGCGPAQMESMYQPSLRAQSTGSVLQIDAVPHH